MCSTKRNTIHRSALSLSFAINIAPRFQTVSRWDGFIARAFADPQETIRTREWKKESTRRTAQWCHLIYYSHRKRSWQETVPSRQCQQPAEYYNHVNVKSNIRRTITWLTSNVVIIAYRSLSCRSFTQNMFASNTTGGPNTTFIIFWHLRVTRYPCRPTKNTLMLEKLQS